jgi:hypothetical protein
MIFCIFNDEKSKMNKRNATRKLHGLVKTGKFVVWQRQEKHGLIKLRSEFVPTVRTGKCTSWYSQKSAWARKHRKVY